MKKEEALQHFHENYVKQKCNEKLLALEKYFNQHKDQLAPDFIESFRQICLKTKEMQQNQEKDKIGYITYSMLRTEIAAKAHTYLIEAHNSTWFFDQKECQAEYNAHWAFIFLDEFETELEEQRKTYFDVITKPDLEKIKLREAAKYSQYVIKLARYAMPKAAALKEFREIERDAELEVRVGEYRDINETIYKEDTRAKDPEEIKAWFQEKSQSEYTYEVFKNLDLSGGDYQDINLSYTELEGSNFTKCNMKNTVLIGANFNGCTLAEADLSQALIHEADFGNSNLKGAVFYQAEGAAGLINQSGWEMPGFIAVSFQGADLEGADFEEANLKGANFKGANLKAVNFREAKLEKAIFSKEAADIINLAEEQKKIVIWDN